MPRKQYIRTGIFNILLILEVDIAFNMGKAVFCANLGRQKMVNTAPCGLWDMKIKKFHSQAFDYPVFESLDCRYPRKRATKSGWGE